MDLVEMPVVQSRFDIVEELSAAEVAAGTQFVAVQLFAQRDIHVDFVRPGLRVATDADIGVGTAEAFGMEISRV